MVKLDGLVAFVAIIEAGSISEAARRLKLSKSVMSERLTELERELGVSLLHRTTRKLTPTENGAVFYERARKVTRDVAEATDELAERRGSLSGPLRIAAPLSFGTLHLGPALYPFLAAHPGIELVLDLNDRFVDLASEGYDMAIRVGQPTDSRLTIRRLAPSRRVLVASPSYIARAGMPLTLGDLETHTAIDYTNRGRADWTFRDGDSLVTVRTGRMALRVNNGDVMRDAAVAGLGIALVPTFIVSGAVAAGRLAVLEVGAEAETDFVYAAFPQGRHRSMKALAISEHLQKVFRNPTYWDEAMSGCAKH